MVSFFRLLFKRPAPASDGEAQGSEKRTGKANRTRPETVAAAPPVRPMVRGPVSRPLPRPMVVPPPEPEPEPEPEVPEAVDSLPAETMLPDFSPPVEPVPGDPVADVPPEREMEEAGNPAADFPDLRAGSELDRVPPLAAAPAADAAPTLSPQESLQPLTIHEEIPVPAPDLKAALPPLGKAMEVPEYPSPSSPPQDAGGAASGMTPPLAEAPAGPAAGTLPPPEIHSAEKAEPALPAAIPAPKPKPGTLELGLRAALRTADSSRLGFDPAKIPGSVRLTLPLDLVRPQMARGKVEIGLEDLRNGVLEKYRPAFARSAEGLRVSVPLSEIFPLLPQEAIPSLGAGKEEVFADMDTGTGFAGLEFVTPFSENAQEEESLRPALFPEAAPTPVPPPLASVPVPGLNSPAASVMTGPPAAAVGDGPGAGKPESGSVPDRSPEGRKPGILPDLAPIAGVGPKPDMPTPPVGMVETPAPVPAPLPLPPPGAAATSWPGLPPLMPSNGVLNRPPGAPAAAPPEPASGGREWAPLPISTALSGPPAKTASESSLPDMEGDDDDDLGEAVCAAALAEPPFHPASPLPLPPLSGSGSPAVNGKGPGHVNGHAAPHVYAPAVPSIPPEPALHEGRNGTRPPPPSPMPLRGDAQANGSGAQPGSGASTRPALEDLSFGCLEDLTQTTLRAVLGTNQMLTAQAVLDHCAALPGLKACGLLRGAHPLSSAAMPPAEAHAFLSSAARTFDSLRMLAETMGLGEGGNFTLRTDQGIRSFFLGNGLCLVVWHEAPVFSSGTREKLMLVARNFPA